MTEAVNESFFYFGQKFQAPTNYKNEGFVFFIALILKGEKPHLLTQGKSFDDVLVQCWQT